MAKVTELTDANFEQFVSSHEAVVVDFHATWCMPCRVVAPLFESVAGESDGALGFGRLNVDEAPVASSKYGISSIPTLLFFKNGRPVDMLVGVRPKSQIAEKTKSLIS